MRREEADRLVGLGLAEWVEEDAIRLRATRLVIRFLEDPWEVDAEGPEGLD